jgi:putative phage-type endonuclease
MSAPAVRRATPDGVLVLPAGAPREEWLEARRWREGVGYCIGASDAPSILDVDEVGTPREVYAEKVLRHSKPEREPMRWGRLLEKAIADEWQHRRRSVIRNVGLISNVEHPWLQCTLDRRVAECPDNPALKSRCALEVKMRGAYRKGRLHAEVPDDLLAQGFVQMLVTGYRHIHLAVLVGGSEMHDPVIWWDDDLAAYIFGELAAYRTRYLIPEVEPDWSQVKPEKEIALDKELNPVRVGTIGIGDVGEVIEYARLAAGSGAAERAKTAAKARLLEIADGAEELRFADKPAVWWREGEQTHVDLDVLARFPEAYAEAVSTKTTWTLCVAKEYKPNETRVS